MNSKKNYYKGTRLLILIMLHVAYVIPRSILGLTDKPETLRKKIKEMVHEGRLVFFKVNNFGKKYWCYAFPPSLTYKKDYEGYYSNLIGERTKDKYLKESKNEISTCRYKENGDSLKVINSAETSIIMLLAGVICTYDMKPELTNNDAKIEYRDNAYYYSSKEIKRYDSTYDNRIYAKDGLSGPEKSVNSSRITGLYLAGNRDYAVFRIDFPLEAWKCGSEYKIKYYLKNLILNKSNAIEMCNYALLLVNDLDEFIPLIREGSECIGRKSLENMYQTFESVYALPFSKEGRIMIEIMKEENWDRKMKGELLDEYTDLETYEPDVECDGYGYAYGQDRYVSFFCIPRIKYLENVIMQAYKCPDEKPLVICFDYQESFVMQACGELCDIRITSLSDYYDFVKNSSSSHMIEDWA